MGAMDISCSQTQCRWCSVCTEMYFQHILLVALSIWKQSTQVVVSPILGAQAVPFHPGGFWRPTQLSQVAGSSVPLYKCCCASNCSVWGPFAEGISTLDLMPKCFLSVIPLTRSQSFSLPLHILLLTSNCFILLVTFWCFCLNLFHLSDLVQM